jgi:hypothetical protein
MIRLIAFAPFALALATSAHAMSPSPLHRADSMTTATCLNALYCLCSIESRLI